MVNEEPQFRETFVGPATNHSIPFHFVFNTGRQINSMMCTCGLDLVFIS
jgi:hypothetical protein